MKTYPVRVPRDPYSGRNDARRRKQASFNDAAQAVERYLNQAMEAEPAGNARKFLTVDIARMLIWTTTWPIASSSGSTAGIMA